jgi:SAM-dependent methyltransferase
VKPDQDHFSPIASDYARGRFVYPETLYRFLAAHCREHHAAWDCATGSGQAARGLVERFSHVTATDISQELLARAPRHPRIVYRAAPAEASGLDPDSVDLVTVAQAVHWFDLPRFWTEVLRVLKPGGVLAFWGYNWPVADPRVDRVLEAFRETIVSAWPERSAILHEGYRSVRPPLDEIACPALEATAHWDVADYLAHLRSWSAVRYHREKTGEDPVQTFTPAFVAAWPGSRIIVRWPLVLKAFRKT